MIELYYWPTPNGHKITMFLEEADVEYTIRPVDISAGDQFKPEYLAISPNNRMPAIIDSAPADRGEPIGVFESGAILWLLDSLQLTASHPVATPANWRRGEDVIIVTSVSDDQARPSPVLAPASRRARVPRGRPAPRPSSSAGSDTDCCEVRRQ